MILAQRAVRRALNKLIQGVLAWAVFLPPPAFGQMGGGGDFTPPDGTPAAQKTCCICYTQGDDIFFELGCARLLDQLNSPPPRCDTRTTLVFPPVQAVPPPLTCQTLGVDPSCTTVKMGYVGHGLPAEIWQPFIEGTVKICKEQCIRNCAILDTGCSTMSFPRAEDLSEFLNRLERECGIDPSKLTFKYTGYQGQTMGMWCPAFGSPVEITLGCEDPHYPPCDQTIGTSCSGDEAGVCLDTAQTPPREVGIRCCRNEGSPVFGKWVKGRNCTEHIRNLSCVKGAGKNKKCTTRTCGGCTFCTSPKEDFEDYWPGTAATLFTARYMEQRNLCDCSRRCILIDIAGSHLKLFGPGGITLGGNDGFGAWRDCSTGEWMTYGREGGIGIEDLAPPTDGPAGPVQCSPPGECAAKWAAEDEKAAADCRSLEAESKRTNCKGFSEYGLCGGRCVQKKEFIVASRSTRGCPTEPTVSTAAGADAAVN